MVVLQIQQFNGFVNSASTARTNRRRRRASTTVCVQTKMAPSRTQVKLECALKVACLMNDSAQLRIFWGKMKFMASNFIKNRDNFAVCIVMES